MTKTATKNEWQETTLGTEGVQLQHGFTFPSGDLSSDGELPVIRIGNVQRGRITIDENIRYAGHLSRKDLSKQIVNYGDILISLTGGDESNLETATGRVGKYCIKTPALLNQRVAKVIPSESIQADYLFYFLSQPVLTRHLASTANGSVQRNLTNGHILNLEVLLPSIDEQRSITEILASLDDKIELLRKQNETLERIAQTIFNEWFVKPTMDVALPHDWEMGTLDDILDVKGGTTPSTKNPEYWDGDIHWTTPKDLSDRPDAFLLDTNSRITDMGLARISSGLLPVGTLLLSSRAPIGYIAISAIPVAINQGYIAINARSPWDNLFTFLWLKANMPLILAAANGSTFMEISKSSFRRIETALPPAKLLESFSKISSPIFDKILLNIRSIKTLSSTRDSLLPRLMSGEIKV